MRELQPEWLIHADAIAAHRTPQELRHLIHDRSFLAGFVNGLGGYGERSERTTGLIRLFEEGGN